MSDTPKKKYQFETKIKLPDMQEILDAASDFTAPSEKKLEVKADTDKKKDIKELAHQAVLSPEQEELQKLGQVVADEEIKRAKAKELARAEELRRLCREREELARQKAEEERKIAMEDKRKAIEAAREKAQARKDAQAAEEAARAAQADADTGKGFQADGHVITEEEEREMLSGYSSGPRFEMPPIPQFVEPSSTDDAKKDSAETMTVQPDTSDSETKDTSEIAENPFEAKPMSYRPIKEKEAFKETVLEDDYKEEMDLREDSSESVDDDSWL
ncbi:MAG: hypothetical protein J5379_06025 [Clostridiales bacterium]|nr:hypothetical protein [Clostridiales bacterium]